MKKKKRQRKKKVILKLKADLKLCYECRVFIRCMKAAFYRPDY